MRANCPAFVAKPGTHVLAEDNGRVVGYAHLDTDGDSNGHPVGEALVHPAPRNRGVGTQLVRRLLALAAIASRGCGRTGTTPPRPRSPPSWA